MPQTTAEFAAALQQDLYEVVYEAYTELPEILAQYVTVEPSTAAFEKSTSIDRKSVV